VFAAFCTSGLWPGLGTTLAASLADCGIRRPDDVTAGSLASLPKVGQLRAGRLFSAFIAAAPTYQVVELLVSAGLPARLAGRAVDLMGPAASRLLRDDPWQVLRLPGVAVPEADRLAQAAIPGVSPSDPRRARALVAFALAQLALSGHTVGSVEQVRVELELYRIPDPLRAIAEATAGELVERVDSVVTSALALTRYADAEREIASLIHRLTDTSQSWSRGSKKRKRADVIDPDGLDPVQRSAVDHAIEHGVSVLTGGPGTGKSRTVAALVRQAERDGHVVSLAAPTGRAAKRLAELCAAEATTIHRLLGAQPRTISGSDPSGEGGRVDFSAAFERGPAWPLDADLVVVDEASMLDVELAAALLRACADGTHVVLVGDAAQLPSIGPGQVLADVIGSGVVPVVELQTLYRQDAGGAIARLATAVRRGELPAVDSPDREVVVVPARGSADCAHRVMQLMTDSIPRALGIAPDDIQVVTPVHRGPAGTIALNEALKARLNPPDTKARRRSGAASRFDPGDRVVATANHLEATPNGFANGEVGMVMAATDRVVTIDFGSGPAEVQGKMLADVSHGWAVTVHRAQGSEFPAVIVVLGPEAGRMLSRPLVYTALTRAQRHLSVVHGTGPALARAIREVGARPRRTLLHDVL
jgi:exodeoxyribonuclease V alpha subunit